MQKLFIELDSKHIDDINIDGQGYTDLNQVSVPKDAVFYIYSKGMLKKIDFVPPKHFVSREATINNQKVYLSNQMSFTDNEWMNEPMIALQKED